MRRRLFATFLLCLALAAGACTNHTPKASPTQAPLADGLVEPGVGKSLALNTSTSINGWTVCPSQKSITAWGTTHYVHPQSVLGFRLASFITQRDSQYGRFLATLTSVNEQTFNCRYIGGTTTPSNHAMAIAVDIRPGSNPQNFSGVFISDFDRFSDADALAFVSSFLRNGFRWGGTWCNPLTSGVQACIDAAKYAFAHEGHSIRNGQVDVMHFEIKLTPAGLRDYMTLKPGRCGDPVLLWKSRLKALGYDVAPHNFAENAGCYGTFAVAATKAFQKAKGLSADGTVGPLSWAKAYP